MKAASRAAGGLIAIAADVALVAVAPAPWTFGTLVLGDIVVLTAGGIAVLAPVRRARGAAVPRSKKPRKPSLTLDDDAGRQLKRARRDAINELTTSIGEIVQGILGLLGHG